MSVYYNENDQKAAAWLRELILAGELPEGYIDTRSIEDVRPSDLIGYTQCHFFAGIGGWPYALRLAGWSDDWPVWTGSCPCQKFSSATRGRRTGADLWPTWFKLIAAKSPGIIFGEQVANRVWLDRTCDDMESLGYEVGAAVLPAVSVGKDHLRHRVYFVCDANRHSESERPINAEASRVSGGKGFANGVVSSDGVSGRVALLRGYGNAIVPQCAAEFIVAYMEAQ